VENLSFFRLHGVKREIRVVGIDDGNFFLRGVGKVNLVGVVFRGGEWVDGVLRTKIDVDGFDATKKIVKMVRESNHYGQIRVLMLTKICFGRSNIVDVEKVFRGVKRPVIVFMRKPLNMGRLKLRVKDTKNETEKLRVLENLKKEFLRIGKDFWMLLFGVERFDAEKILEITLKNTLPEPLRVARLVALSLNRLKT